MREFVSPETLLFARRAKQASFFDQQVEIERLADVVSGTQLEQAHRAIDRAVAGDENERRQNALLLASNRVKISSPFRSGRWMSLMIRS